MSAPGPLLALAADIDVAVAFDAHRGWHLAPEARLINLVEEEQEARRGYLTAGRVLESLDRINEDWRKKQGYAA